MRKNATFLITVLTCLISMFLIERICAKPQGPYPNGFELTCPVGSQPVSQYNTWNPQTQRFRANMCVDSNGSVTLNSPNLSGNVLSSTALSVGTTGTGVGTAAQFSLVSGNGGAGSGSGGTIAVLAGNASSSGTGGPVTITAGNSPGSTGGNILLTPGTGVTAAANGTVSVAGGFLFNPPPFLFANLGTPANGALVYCSDCTVAATCAGVGSGAMAKRLNGIWVCN